MATKYISPGVYEIDGKRVVSPDGTKAGAEKKHANSLKSESLKATSQPAPRDMPTKTQQTKSGKSGKEGKDGKGGKGAKEDKEVSEGSSIDDVTVRKPTYEESKLSAEKLLSDSLAYGDTLSNKYIDDSAFEELGLGRTQEEQDALNAAKSEYQSASSRSADATLALSKFKEALSGLSSEEGTALREGARAELDKEYAAKQNQARALAIKSGARGGAVAAQAGIMARDRAKAQKELSRDFVLKNVDIKNQALQNFGGYVRGLESDEASRRQAASRDLSTQTNVQTDRDLGKQQFNIGQRQNKVNARLTAALGGAGVAAGAIQGQQGTDAAYENVKAQLELAKKQLEESQKQTDIYAKSVGVGTKSKDKKKAG